MGDVAQEVVPHGESFTEISSGNTGPESLNNDHVVHHDDDPRETAKDENDRD